MDKTGTTKFKWFWGWQDEKQEAWLEAMSQQGYHLQYIRAFGRYVFDKGAPRNYTYRMDFDQTSGKESDYFDLIRDAGWERVTQVAGWQYWRKEKKGGTTPEIFTDNESKISKYKRLLVSLSSPVPALMVIVMAIFKRFPGRHPQWFVILVISLFMAYTIFIALNLLKIAQRINALKQMKRF